MLPSKRYLFTPIAKLMSPSGSARTEQMLRQVSKLAVLPVSMVSAQQKYARTLVSKMSSREKLPETLPTLPEKKSPKKRKNASQTSELLGYVESILSPADLKLLHQTKYLKVKRELTESLYLINENVAKTFADLVQPHIQDRNATVIEFNPGLGFLTSQLRNNLRLININCLEDNEAFCKNLSSKIEGVNVIEDTNFMVFPRMHHLDKLDGGNRIFTSLSKVKKLSEETESKSEKLYVFGSTPEIDFINFTIKSLATQKVLFDDDSYDWTSNNITYFVALGSKPYTIINATSELGFTVYRATSILFQILFNYALLGLLPRKAFVPWETTSKQLPEVPEGEAATATTTNAKNKPKRKRPQTIPHDPNTVCIIKFSPNMVNIEKIGKSNLFLFWYFVRHHLFARRNFVIPELEQWIPGCGPRLIRKGYTIYTQFGSLTPHQVLEIYLDFSSWPEFQSSSFLTAAERYQHKLDTHEEEIIEFSKSPKFHQ